MTNTVVVSICVGVLLKPIFVVVLVVIKFYHCI